MPSSALTQAKEASTCGILSILECSPFFKLNKFSHLFLFFGSFGSNGLKKKLQLDEYFNRTELIKDEVPVHECGDDCFEFYEKNAVVQHIDKEGNFIGDLTEFILPETQPKKSKGRSSAAATKRSHLANVVEPDVPDEQEKQEHELTDKFEQLALVRSVV